jgi:hypothetical protein
MKIATFLLTALLNIAFAFLMFFMLIISLNGFSERQATPGLLLFIVWSLLLSSIATGILSVLLANYLAVKKAMNRLAAAAISIVSFVIVGGISTIAGFFAAVFLVSALR